MQNQNIFLNLKYPTGFDKVVSSGIFSSYFKLFFVDDGIYSAEESCI